MRVTLTKTEDLEQMLLTRRRVPAFDSAAVAIYLQVEDLLAHEQCLKLLLRQRKTRRRRGPSSIQEKTPIPIQFFTQNMHKLLCLSCKNWMGMGVFSWISSGQLLRVVRRPLVVAAVSPSYSVVLAVDHSQL